MQGIEFAALTAFVAVAEHGNFSKAAVALGVSTSTMSHTIRSLEERLGVRLLNRTTRSVALTEAGAQLLQQIHPALDELGNAIEALAVFSSAPAGVLRLAISSLAGPMIIDPILPRLRAHYPEITLDLVVDDSQSDIVDGRFDAGIRSGARIERDMITLRVSPESRMITVAAPAYVDAHGKPDEPGDLREHDCIRYRKTTGAIHPWAFERDGEHVEAAVTGSLITDRLDHVVRTALNGGGIAYLLEDYVAAHLAAGRLVPVLDAWTLPFPGYYLFYPSRRQMPPKLSAVIEVLRAARPAARTPHPRIAMIDAA